MQSHLFSLPTPFKYKIVDLLNLCKACLRSFLNQIFFVLTDLKFLYYLLANNIRLAQ